MAWSSFSAVTVATVWPADQRKESETTASAGQQPATYTPVRNADTNVWTRSETDIHSHTQTHKTHTQQTNKSVTDTDKHFSALHAPEMHTYTDTEYLRHSFLPKLLTQTASGRIDMIPGKVIHPEGCNSARRNDPIPHEQMRSRKLGSDISEVFGRSIHVVGNGRAVLFLFLWNFKPQLLQ